MFAPPRPLVTRCRAATLKWSGQTIKGLDIDAVASSEAGLKEAFDGGEPLVCISCPFGRG